MATAPALPDRRTRTLILFALAMGGFAIGTSEFAMMGLMPNLTRGFGVDEPAVGHLISSYAIGVVVGAPLLAILGARLRVLARKGVSRPVPGPRVLWSSWRAARPR